MDTWEAFFIGIGVIWDRESGIACRGMDSRMDTGKWLDGLWEIIL